MSIEKSEDWDGRYLGCAQIVDDGCLISDAAAIVIFHEFRDELNQDILDSSCFRVSASRPKPIWTFTSKETQKFYKSLTSYWLTVEAC